MDKKRRNLLGSMALAPVLLGAPSLVASPSIKTFASTRLQYSINAYTFNSLLKSGEMTFFDMMEFAATLGLNAVDLTGYYFSGYLQLGLNISWTGVRNNFANPDKTSRASDIELIKNWLTASSKLGASIMRIFAGKGKHEGYSRDEVKEWMVSDFC